MLICLFGLAVLFTPTRDQSVNADLLNIAAALLKTIDPEAANVIVASRSLGRDAAAAFRVVRPNVIVHTNTEIAFPVPDFVIVIDTVTLSGANATVRLRRGRIPGEMGWVCGQAMTVPLRRTDKWSVLADGELRLRCAVERVLEAARLAFSAIRLGPRVQVVAGTTLTAEALATLEAIKQVPPRKPFETETMSLPADVFVVRKLEENADRVEFAGTLGPVPRFATLGCGTNWDVTLRRHADGWSFEKTMLTVC